MSYSEWLTRRTLQAPKYLDTRPHGDASQFTETVKRQATVVRGRGAASDFVGYNAGAAYSEGTAANTKGPQIEIGPVPPNPPSGDYGILTGFDLSHRLYYSNFGITGDFTVELFFKTSDPASSQYLWRIENNDNVGMRIRNRNLELRRDPGSDPIIIESPEANRWYHVAVTRENGTWYTSVNGVTVGIDNANIDLSNSYLVIGDYDRQGDDPFYDGSISNFRVTESALYTTPTYSIPTLPLSGQGARLLLLAKQDAPFADSAGTNVAEGSCTWQAGPIPTIPPPFPDYGILTGFEQDNVLYYPTFSIPANFTVELFFKTSNTSNSEILWEIENENNISMRIRNGNLYFIGILEDILMIGEVDEDRWYHVAVSREGSTWYTSVDGSTVFRGSQVINFTGADLTIGTDDIGEGAPFENGSISNFRVSNTALYTENYTIPTLPLGDEDAVFLLLAKPGDRFGDSAGTNVSEYQCEWTPGPIVPLPSFSLFGILSNVNFDAGTVTLLSEFTVEFFANLGDSDDTYFVRILKGNKYLRISQNGLGIFVQGITSESATIPSGSEYYHYAICGRNGQAALYINGARATPFISYDLDADSDFLIGSQTFTGSLTNFRFTNGQALYGDVYQIPTLPLTRGDLLLLGKQNAITTDSAGNFDVTGTANWTRGPISVEPPLPFELYGSLSGFSSSNTLLVNPIDPITGDFTIEAFVEMSGINTQTFFSFGTFVIAFSGGVTVFIDGNSFGVGELPTGLSGYLTHFAISGNTDTGFGCYINGTRIEEYIGGITLSGVFYIGNSAYGPLTGSITNFRISNTAYSGQTIPIPSLPLSGGRFLLRFSPDALYVNSGTDNTIGTTTVGELELAPILPPPPYQDYGILDFGESFNTMVYPTFEPLQDFTVELFFKSSSTTIRTIWSSYGNTLNSDYNLGLLMANNRVLKVFLAPSYEEFTLGTLIPDKWYHIAVTRQGDTWYSSVDGTIAQLTQKSINIVTSSLFIGSQVQNTATLTSGSISNFRVTNSALYTTDFAVPAPPLIATTDTRLLLLAKPGDRFKDSSVTGYESTYTPGWTSGPIPLYPYYGVLEFTETEYLTVNPSPTLTDFTIEWFARPTDIQTCGIFDLLKSGEPIWCYFTNGNLVINEDTNVRLAYPLPDAVNNWLHYAICRSSGTTRVYVNGSQIAANIGAMFSFSEATLRIGFSDEAEFKGSLTNFRISNTALYSGTYTVPSLPLSGGQLLLLAKPGSAFVDSAGGTVTGTALSRLGPIDL